MSDHSCHVPDFRARRERAALAEALEETPDHNLTLDEWGDLLLSLLPGEHGDSPAPAPCHEVLSFDGRLDLMARRVAGGYRPVHPDDSWVGDDDSAGGYVLRNGRNGATYAAEEVSRG